MAELQKCVVGAQDPDGSVVFQYGWTRAITTRCVREFGAEAWTTSLQWASKPTSSRTYPTDADFARQLPEGRRELTASPAGGE